MNEISDDIAHFAAGRIDLKQLCENFRQTLATDPSRRQDSAAWLSQCEANGRISTSVCNSLRAVLNGFDAQATLARSVEPERPTTARLAVGSFLGANRRYELERLLGEGGMGQVFKTHDHLMNRTVALKVLGESFSQNPDAYRALKNETVRAQELDAPNVVKVFNFDEDGVIAFMLMEYLEGKTLEQALSDRADQPMSVAQAWPILKCIGNALSAAHEQSLVHSDLKPSNVFICAKGAIKVLDFGIARQFRKSTDATVGTWGAEALGAYTPPYASLEQILGEPADPRDDIYAFGCVAYRLLSGAHPFGETSADRAMRSKLMPNHIEQLNSRQWQALKHTLAFKRADRTATLQEFLREFEPPSRLRQFRVPIVLTSLALVSGTIYVSAKYFRYYITGNMLETGTMMEPLTNVRAVHGPLTQDQQHEVNDALTLAREFLSDAKSGGSAEDLAYVLSEGANNVNQILDSVLHIDPDDAEALKMKKEIAGLYLEKANLELHAGNTAVAAKLLRYGRKVEPSNRDLYETQMEVCKQSPAACVSTQN